MTQQSDWKRLLILDEIGENEFMTLYNWSEIKKLSPDQILFNEGDTEQTAYFILSGKIQIMQKRFGQLKTLATLGAGEWIDEVALIRKYRRTNIAIVHEPSVVMAITPMVLEALNDQTQLVFYKYLASLLAKRTDRLVAGQQVLQKQNNLLIQNLFFQKVQNRADATQAELVVNVIKKIPRLPSFGRSVALSSLGHDFSPTQVANQIKQDPALVGAVLKVVNSAHYGLHAKISDIHHAILLLGSNMISQLVIAESLRKIMPNKPMFREFQVHAQAISQLTFLIAKQAQHSNPAQASTFGLLHDLGKIVIAYLKESNPKNIFFIDMLDPAQLGAMLFKEWQFPELFCHCVELQYYPDFSRPENVPKEILEPVTINFLAHCCYDYFRGEDDKTPSSPFFNEYLAVLNWGGMSLNAVVDRHLMAEIRKQLHTYPIALRELFDK